LTREFSFRLLGHTSPKNDRLRWKYVLWTLVLLAPFPFAMAHGAAISSKQKVTFIVVAMDVNEFEGGGVVPVLMRSLASKTEGLYELDHGGL
jgi:hypothetical protein